MNRLNSAHCIAVRLVLVARRRLDCDALAALFQSHSHFRALCTTTSVKVAAEIARHRRPDLVVLDGHLIDESSDEGLESVLLQFDDIPILVLDDEIKNGRLAAILNSAHIGYFTRDVPFEEIANGIDALVRGERAFGPIVLDRIQLTSHGWVLRKDSEHASIAALTPREMEVFKLVALGHSIKHCAAVLALAPSTVDNHKARLMKKLGVHKSHDLTRLAIREGLVIA
jgi:two-component system, NarL family, response regulator NreC